MEQIKEYLKTKSQKEMPKCDTREECKEQLANLIELTNFLQNKLQTFETIKNSTGNTVKLSEIETVCIEDIRKAKVYTSGDNFDKFLQKLEKKEGLKACASLFKSNKDIYNMLKDMSPEELKIIFGSTNTNLNKYIKRGLAATAVSLLLNQALAKKQFENLKQKKRN